MNTDRTNHHGLRLYMWELPLGNIEFIVNRLTDTILPQQETIAFIYHYSRFRKDFAATTRLGTFVDYA